MGGSSSKIKGPILGALIMKIILYWALLLVAAPMFGNSHLVSHSSQARGPSFGSRTDQWFQPWLPEAQHGFQTGWGMDDVQQVTRRVIEEIALAQTPMTALWLSCFATKKRHTHRSAAWRFGNSCCSKAAQRLHGGVPGHSRRQFNKANFETAAFVVLGR